MYNYKYILSGYGKEIQDSNYIRYLMLCCVNECVDATRLVYKYLESVDRRSIKKYYYRRKLVCKYGIFIGDNAKIGSGLRLPHPCEIVIGDGVVIGDNVTIYQGVTFGSKNFGEKAYPTIEDGCVIFPGTKIFGKIVLHDGSTIGANSVINVSTENNSVYAGNPGRRIR